jgi:hypothetical protein
MRALGTCRMIEMALEFVDRHMNHWLPHSSGVASAEALTSHPGPTLLQNALLNFINRRSRRSLRPQGIMILLGQALACLQNGVFLPLFGARWLGPNTGGRYATFLNVEPTHTSGRWWASG